MIRLTPAEFEAHRNYFRTRTVVSHLATHAGTPRTRCCHRLTVCFA